jgi:ribonucleoside-triphosphate reductase
MERLIRTREGNIVNYDRGKVERAITKALHSSNAEVDSSALVMQVEVTLQVQYFKLGNVPTVEQIQDAIEEVLIFRGLTETAKNFILYRKKRIEARETKDILKEAEKLVGRYINRKDWRVSENSNMNYSLQGLNYYLSSAVTAKYWLSKIYTKKIKDCQHNGEFHIHDLGILGPYCVGWDLLDLLKRGFTGVTGKVESAPAKHFRTALGHVVNFFYTLQGEAAGAQAFSNFDTLLAPFIHYDNLTYAEVKQCMQEFIFNINVPTRVGFQTPFTNVTMDLKVPKMFFNMPVTIGGEEQDKVYGDFQKEMNLFNRAFCEVMMAGDASGRIFTFPIPTYNLTKDFEWANDELKPLWEMTGKYGIPYFSNFVNSDMNPEDARSMCCRLRLDHRELTARGGGLFGSNPLTGSIGVVTINIPRLTLLAEKNEANFFERLSLVMETAKDSLELKRKFIEDLTERGLFPYTHFFLRSVKDCGGKYWANHFSTIGIIGMNEACLNLLGVGINTPSGKAWVEKVLDVMRTKLADFQEETGNLYNLEATPAEGTSYKLAMRDKKDFAKAHTQGEVTPYYTNSVHLPVNTDIDIFNLLNHQDSLQTLFTGGTVVHLFLGESINDWKVVRDLTRKIVTKFKLPYFSITPTFSICPVHGYLAGEHKYCPFPHSDEEMKKYGLLVPQEEVDQLPSDSIRTIAEMQDLSVTEGEI